MAALLAKVQAALRLSIADLDRQRAKLEGALVALGGGTGTKPKPRGRKMTPAQRRAVSVRMKAYWRKRRG